MRIKWTKFPKFRRWFELFYAAEMMVKSPHNRISKIFDQVTGLRLRTNVEIAQWASNVEKNGAILRRHMTSVLTIDVAFPKKSVVGCTIFWLFFLSFDSESYHQRGCLDDRGNTLKTVIIGTVLCLSPTYSKTREHTSKGVSLGAFYLRTHDFKSNMYM